MRSPDRRDLHSAYVTATLMLTLLASLVFGAAFGGLCSDEQFQSAASTVWVGLQERDEAKPAHHGDNGALVLSWRADACELLEGNPTLYDATRAAIESECFRADDVESNKKNDRDRTVLRVINERAPDIIALAWKGAAASPKDAIYHVVVSDQAFSATYRLPSYGESQELGAACEVGPSLWNIKNTSAEASHELSPTTDSARRTPHD